MSDAHLLVLCTCPEKSATGLAEGLVEARLAACVNILPAITSVYHWEGSLESASESLLMIKTNSGRFGALRDHLTDRHPYELPEIIAVPIEDGLAPYLTWIDERVSTVGVE